MLSSRTCGIGKTNRFYSHRIHRRKGTCTLLQSGALRQIEYDVMRCDVGSVGIETSIRLVSYTFFSFRLCVVIFPAKATNNPHGLGVRLTIGVVLRFIVHVLSYLCASHQSTHPHVSVVLGRI